MELSNNTNTNNNNNFFKKDDIIYIITITFVFILLISMICLINKLRKHCKNVQCCVKNIYMLEDKENKHKFLNTNNQTIPIYTQTIPIQDGSYIPPFIGVNDI